MSYRVNHCIQVNYEGLVNVGGVAGGVSQK